MAQQAEPVSEETYALITNQAALTVARLVSQFQSNNPQSPNKLEKFLTVFGNQIQAVENMMVDLRNLRRILVVGGVSATGAQLDGMGSIVGERRGGLDDITYRQRILTRIRINLSSGTTEEIIEALCSTISAAQGSCPSLQIKSFFPAKITVLADGVVVNGLEIARLLRQMAAGGVQRYFIFDTSADAFMFASASSIETSTTNGFSDVAMTTGGTLSWVA